MKKETRKERMMNTISNNEGATREEYKKLTIIEYMSGGRPTVAIFNHIYTGFKPTYHYVFDNIEQRSSFIMQQKALMDKDMEREARSAKEAAEKRASIKVGTILVNSWGYEQTNVDFYKVIGVTKGTVKVVELKSKLVPNRGGYMSGYKVASNEVNDDTIITKRFGKRSGVPQFQFGSTSIWNGEEMYFSTYA